MSSEGSVADSDTRRGTIVCRWDVRRRIGRYETGLDVSRRSEVSERAAGVELQDKGPVGWS